MSEVDDPLVRLAESARGWHTIQLAVLGFIGICGVLHNAVAAAPGWVQVIAAILAAIGLVLACVAIFLVGRVAWPTERSRWQAAQARLRGGIRLTVAAVILVVLATLAGWWPRQAESPVLVTGAQGQTWCGPLVSAPSGAIGVRTANGAVDVPIQAVAQVSPISDCP